MPQRAGHAQPDGADTCPPALSSPRAVGAGVTRALLADWAAGAGCSRTTSFVIDAATAPAISGAPSPATTRRICHTPPVIDIRSVPISPSCASRSLLMTYQLLERLAWLNYSTSKADTE